MSHEITKTLEKARKTELSADEYRQLTSMKNMDALRPLVAEEDLSWITQNLLVADDERFAFLLSLLHKFAARPEVQELLRSLWSGVSETKKISLFWRVLDDPELPLHWHQVLFNFVDENWELFKEACLPFNKGTPEGVLAGNVERYLGKDFPETKKWAYLCSIATVAGYPSAVTFSLNRGSESAFPFERTVATRLAERLSLEVA